MNIHEEDYPYSIYKRPDGDELLDAHNDIIAVFDPHTEPEIERLIVAAPDMKDLLWDAWQDLNALSNGDQSCDARYEATETMEKIMSLLRRIDGEEGTNA